MISFMNKNNCVSAIDVMTVRFFEASSFDVNV